MAQQKMRPISTDGFTFCGAMVFQRRLKNRRLKLPVAESMKFVPDSGCHRAGADGSVIRWRLNWWWQIFRKPGN